jgi:hypothetical protein
LADLLRTCCHTGKRGLNLTRRLGQLHELGANVGQPRRRIVGERNRQF